jgi:hypothetical protein
MAARVAAPVSTCVLLLALGGCSGALIDDGDDPDTPASHTTGADHDGDGFTDQGGDCNDFDPLIGPNAVEVEGIRCKTAEDCPGAAGGCHAGYCRCKSTADCSSGAACKGHGDCAGAGEKCVEGRCASSLACLAPPAWLSPQGGNVCRDNRDNDCDGKIDERPSSCDLVGQLSPADPRDFARSMELCDLELACSASKPCPGKLRCAGGRCSRVLGAQFNSGAAARARDIASSFAKGGPVRPQAGASFVVLSTGLASYVPGQTCPQPGTVLKGTHGDPSKPGAVAYDYSELALQILVPSNAQSLEFDFHFFSMEFPEYLDSEFNDTFWVQLSSKKLTGNISFDKNKTPIQIKNAFFDICDSDPAYPKSQGMCSRPAAQLKGTGYGKDCAPPPFGKRKDAPPDGGSTGWLHTAAPVTPGETIRLVFSIFDKGDAIYDSTVLIDNFRWNLAPATRAITRPIE